MSSKGGPKTGRFRDFLKSRCGNIQKTLTPRQNTDPWVFGDCFRYSNCKQQSQRALQQLAPGSLILFGSTLDGNFVADTVFVVRDSQWFRRAQPPDCDDAFRVCTIQSLLTDTECSGEAFTLYRGATHDVPVNGMYSFVPCRREDCGQPRFCRPTISLPVCYLNPASTQSPSGAKVPRSVAEICDLWEKIRQQVLDWNCELGISFSTPRLDDGRMGPGPSR
jgi:hypothetical protein